MGEDAKDEFAGLGVIAAGGQSRSEPPFVLTEAALCVPALVVEGAVEAFAHAPSVWRLRPAPPGVAPVEADHRPPNAEVFAAEPVVVLGVVTRIAQDSVDSDQRACLPHGGNEVGRVLARPDAGHRSQNEMGGRVHDSRQLRPRPLSVALPSCPSHPEVGADVAGLQPGGVDRGNGLRTDQAARPCTSNQRGLGMSESPPTSASARIRREACASVE